MVEVERLSFVGNRAFSDRRLRQVLETKQAGLLRNFIQRDTFIAERLELDKQVLTRLLPVARLSSISRCWTPRAEVGARARRAPS